ncbi:RimK/LysX family protein [Thiomicrospira sp. R3]|uniref:ATP-dependent zinc protease family protein n=1 Tax=Thiomicrospira sp. R3 TaxID=3035472 RepID=UPI00259BB638|nr:RimK/LysX family protein [Thiomicrospira sp. R3]WFE68214.1 RimK/LysX family protein [Thiomicrospira sp. R3]
MIQYKTAKHVLTLLLVFMAGVLLSGVVVWYGSESAKTLSAIEPVYFTELNLVLSARVDTGAQTSSLSARNIEMFRLEGENWVRFEIVHPNLSNEVKVEAPVARFAEIKQANHPEPVSRPVVALVVEVQQHAYRLEFSLTDRSHLHYPVLLGRNLLQQGWLVDINQ